VFKNSSGAIDIISLAKRWEIKIIPVEGCVCIFYLQISNPMIYLIIEILKYFSKHPVSAEDSAYTPVQQNSSNGELII